MAKSYLTDKDVACQIASILVREISAYQASEDQALQTTLEDVIDAGASPFITYAALAAELNQSYDLASSKSRFTPLNLDVFLGILLRESVNFRYKTGDIWHLGKIRKKMEVDLPITAIVVNAKTHLPGKQLFSTLDLPHATTEESRASTVALLSSLLSFRDWGDYMKRVEKVFGK